MGGKFKEIYRYRINSSLLGKLEEKISYIFKDKSLLEKALIHPSFSVNNTFQKLEFVGDKVLSQELAIRIYYHSKDPEKMSIILANLVNNKHLAKVGSFLKEFIKSKGPLTINMIADSLEALIGAIKIDGGDPRELIKDLWPLDKEYKKNSKNSLQEIAQKEGYSLVYEIISSPNGYLSKVSLNNRWEGISIAPSKKEASIKAALKVLKEYERDKNRINRST